MTESKMVNVRFSLLADIGFYILCFERSVALLVFNCCRNAIDATLHGGSFAKLPDKSE